MTSPRAAGVGAGPAGDGGRLLGRGRDERARDRDRALLQCQRADALERAGRRAADEVDERADLAERAGGRAVGAQDVVAEDADVADRRAGLAGVDERGLGVRVGLGELDRVAVVAGVSADAVPASASAATERAAARVRLRHARSPPRPRSAGGCRWRSRRRRRAPSGTRRRTRRARGAPAPRSPRGRSSSRCRWSRSTTFMAPAKPGSASSAGIISSVTMRSIASRRSGVVPPSMTCAYMGGLLGEGRGGLAEEVLQGSKRSALRTGRPSASNQSCARAVVVELDAVAVGVVEVDRDRAAVVGGVVDRDSRGRAGAGRPCRARGGRGRRTRRGRGRCGRAAAASRPRSPTC